MRRLNLISLIVLAAAFLMAMGIDLNNLLNYANQTKPVYITRDNTPPGNTITDAGATLGRVLFYDKALSLNGTIACASCHQQAFAFGDTARLSKGLNGGLTGRHSMRLVNARFSAELKFFWNERAASLEDQTSRPIQDMVEMGFSGTSGQPGIDSLIRRMEKIDYYPRLFQFVFGDSTISEARIQRALGQFIRSIQSFDSKFDLGRAQSINLTDSFPNFTAQENQGKNIFLTPPNAGGMGCQACHRAPEFDIDPATLNNGVIADAQTPATLDLANTRSPSLRDLVNPQGILNGPMMHNGSFTSIRQVLNHYNQIPVNPANTALDPRVGGPNGMGQNLGKTPQELDAVEAFLRTLSGVAIYSDVRWSDPFDSNGNLTVLPLPPTAVGEMLTQPSLGIYPNPAKDYIQLSIPVTSDYEVSIFTTEGKQVFRQWVTTHAQLNISALPTGLLLLTVQDKTNGYKWVFRVMHQE